MIGEVRVDSVIVDLNTISADVVIRVGRSDIFTKTATSTCRIVFRGVTTDTTTPYVGTIVEVYNTVATKVFEGVITDAVLTVETSTSGANLTVTALGNTTRAGFTLEGLATYPGEFGTRSEHLPAETIDQRLARFNTLLPSPAITIQAYKSVTDRNLTAYVGPDQSVIAHIENISDSARGLFYDAGNGNLYWQDVEWRNAQSVLTFDPDAVLFAPIWVQNAQVVNDVTVNYSGTSVFTFDQRSIDLYGRRELSVSTILVDSANASALASSLLSRSKRPRWQIESIGYVQGPTEVTYLVGQPVKITNLPAGSPAPIAYGIVEGYEHRYIRDTHTTTYFLSDPVQSGIALAWEDLPADAASEWQDALPIVWDDAITLSDLFAS